MTEFIKKLPTSAEFIIVISFCFGYSILFSIIIFVNNLFGSSSYYYAFTNAQLVSTICYEILFMMLAFAFLKVRDNQIEWSSNTGLWKLIGKSIFLFLLYYITYILLIIIVNSIFPQIKSSMYPQINMESNLNLILVLSLSIVNPIFEEMVVVGYIIPTLIPRIGILYAINISVLIRFLYHLYQGPIAAISIIPMGIIFAILYIKWKNIWPLIIVHGILDFLALYGHSL